MRQGQAARHEVGGVAAHQIEVGGGQHRDGDAGAREFYGGGVEFGRRQRRQFGGVADGDAALIVAALGLAADLVEMPPGGIEVEIEMQVDIDVEGLREIEQFFQMRRGIGVHIGTAADRLAAVAQGGDQQLLGAGIVGQAFLRKHAERQIDRPGVIALQRLDRLEAAQADARIDLDMGAHPRGAGHDRALQHPGAALIDILDGEIALHGGDRLDGLADAAMVVAAAAEQAGLVEVDVGVDEARQHQPAIDSGFRGLPTPAAARSRRSGRRRRRYRPVGPMPASPRGGKSGQRRFSGSSGQANEGAGQGQLQIVCRLSTDCSNYVHAI